MLCNAFRINYFDRLSKGSWQTIGNGKTGMKFEQIEIL